MKSKMKDFAKNIKLSILIISAIVVVFGNTHIAQAVTADQTCAENQAIIDKYNAASSAFAKFKGDLNSLITDYDNTIYPNGDPSSRALISTDAANFGNATNNMANGTGTSQDAQTFVNGYQLFSNYITTFKDLADRMSTTYMTNLTNDFNAYMAAAQAYNAVAPNGAPLFPIKYTSFQDLLVDDSGQSYSTPPFPNSTITEWENVVSDFNGTRFDGGIPGYLSGILNVMSNTGVGTFTGQPSDYASWLTSALNANNLTLDDLYSSDSHMLALIWGGGVFNNYWSAVIVLIPSMSILSTFIEPAAPNVQPCAPVAPNTPPAAINPSVPKVPNTGSANLFIGFGGSAVLLMLAAMFATVSRKHAKKNIREK